MSFQPERNEDVCIKSIQNIKDGMKFDQEKSKWDLLPLDELDGCVRVLTIGAKKYAPYNWLKVDNGRSRYYSAMLRHIKAWQSGDFYDQETKEHHLDHALCCLIFLRHFAVKEDGANCKESS